MGQSSLRKCTIRNVKQILIIKKSSKYFFGKCLRPLPSFYKLGIDGFFAFFLYIIRFQECLMFLPFENPGETQKIPKSHFFVHWSCHLFSFKFNQIARQIEIKIDENLFTNIFPIFFYKMHEYLSILYKLLQSKKKVLRFF